MYDPILVLGSGRCGTSAVAGILHHLGVFMGDRFVPANDTNKYGHWEDKDFHDTNAAFMNANITERQWHYNIKKITIDRRALMRPWGFKDPRTCDLLDLYKIYYPNPRIIWCKRNLDDVVASMKKAYGWKQQEAMALIKRREDNIERFILNTHCPYTVNFEQLINDKKSAVDGIQGFVQEPNLKNAYAFIRSTKDVGGASTAQNNNTPGD
jgi:hypothetical protein